MNHKTEYAINEKNAENAEYSHSNSISFPSTFFVQFNRFSTMTECFVNCRVSKECFALCVFAPSFNDINFDSAESNFNLAKGRLQKDSHYCFKNIG